MLISAAVCRAADRPPLVETLELDEPRSDEVLVRIIAVGVCHTDLFAPGIFPLPAVFGHEGAGIVERVGGAVSKLRRGDRVAMTFGSCGHCRLCNDGIPAYCEQGHDLQFAGARTDGSTTLAGVGGERVHGSFFQQSSFATYALGSERSVVKLPDAMPLELAAPLGCGIQTGAGAVLNSLAAGEGSSIAIFGVGAVGLAAVMGARIAGCDIIIAVDVNADRLELAREFGATHSLDARAGDVAERIKGIARGGVHFSLDTAGQVQTFNDAIDCLARRGSAAIVTVPKSGGTFDFSGLNLLLGGKRLIAVLEGDSVPDHFIPQLAQYYLQGRLPLDRITKEYSFKDIATALGDAHHQRAIKPILRMD